MSSELHVTIGTHPENRLSGVTLETDIRLVKAALLYADRVKLCSLSASILTLISQLPDMTDDEKLAALRSWSDFLGDDFKHAYDAAAERLAQVRTLERKKVKSRKEILALGRAKRGVSEGLNGASPIIEGIITRAGANEIVMASKAGILEVQVYPMASSDRMVSDFISSVGSAVLSGATFPLFDDSTRGLVRTGIAAGAFPTELAGATKGRVAGVAADLLGRLPVLDSLSMEELISIRRELERPLVNFRAAVIGYAKTIAPAQWDANFAGEADLVFHERVAPAVQAIEDAVKSNGLLKAIWRNASMPLVLPASSALGVVVSTVASFSPLAGAVLGSGLGGVSAAASAVREWQEKTRDIERNQLYFYYRAGQPPSHSPKHV